MEKLVLLGLLAMFGRQICAQFVCPKTGLFPDPRTPGCTHYHLCIVTGTHQVVNSRHKCPLDFVFHEKLKICVSPLVYQCPPAPVVPFLDRAQPNLCQEQGICTTTVAPTPTPTTTVKPAGHFVCPGSGDYPNDMSLDCKNYHFCARRGELPRPAVCPGLTIFSWAQRACLPSDGFVCALQSEPFDCPGVGDFPNPNSLDNSTYFECFAQWNEEVLYQMRICKSGEMFNTAVGRCA